jgi:hypothetical protein
LAAILAQSLAGLFCPAFATAFYKAGKLGAIKGFLIVAIATTLMS